MERLSDGTPPLVSIVMPVYNGERYVTESLESVFAQTYANIEVVVVDDASTDSTRRLLEPYVAEGKIRYSRNARNLGQFGTVNVGLAAARGELIGIQHADDKQLPQLVEREVRALAAHPDAGAVFALDILIDPDGREYFHMRLPDEFRGGGVFVYEQLVDGLLRYGNVFLRAPTSLVRREVYDAVGGFSDRWGLRGDLDMWLRIARAHPLVILDEHLTRYRWGHENVSAAYEKLRDEAELTFKLLDETLASHPAVVAPAAIRAFEARRAEDMLIVAANRYVRSELARARQILSAVALSSLLRSRYVKRWRLVALWLGLSVLCRLPRSALVARAFYRRWGKGR